MNIAGPSGVNPLARQQECVRPALRLDRLVTVETARPTPCLACASPRRAGGSVGTLLPIF